MEKNSSTPPVTPRRGWHRLKVAGALAIAATVSACALIKTGYENADTVGMFWINGYLDLSSEQKDYVKPKLRTLIAWHRKTQLPDYKTLAQTLKKRADTDITAAEVTDIQKQFRERIETMVQHAIPEAADLALRLTPENIKVMQDKFEDNDDKFRDDMMRGDTDRQNKARYEKTLDRAEEWYGRFSKDQRAQIRKWSDARPLNNDAMLAERQRREKEMIDLLTKVQKEKPSRDQVIALLKDYAQRFEWSPDPQRRAFQEAYRKATYEMDAAIHNQSTPAQRAKAKAKLQDWSDTFDELSK